MAKLFCVVFRENSIFSVQVDLNETVDNLKRKIWEHKQYEFPYDEMNLYVTLQGNEWLSARNKDLVQLKSSKVPKTIMEKYVNDANEMNPLLKLSNFFSEHPPSDECVHVLVVVAMKTGDRKRRLDLSHPSGNPSQRLNTYPVQGAKWDRPYIDSLVAKLKQSQSVQKLIYSSGRDFPFSDRTTSFATLAQALNARYKAIGVNDRRFHPLPFLADGPGSGKSRFLEELAMSFKEFVINDDNNDYDEKFQETLSKATYINITFGNGTPFEADDLEIGIEKAICIRIFQRFASEDVESLDSLKKRNMLGTLLETVFKDTGCLVLGIDEINRVWSSDHGSFRELVSQMGKYSCSAPIFFVPILAGTVIGPTRDIVKESMHPPLPIPLPFLSLNSSMRIVETALTQKGIPDMINDKRLKHLVSDTSGHCRALEYLFDAILLYNSNMEDFFDSCCFYVRIKIEKEYKVEEPALGVAIAYSFLSRTVDHTTMVESPKVKYGMTFRDLEETGVIKLIRSDNGYLVKLPFSFVWSYLQTKKADDFAKFWSNLLIGSEIGWQKWERFNRNYLAFRLSLFAYLGHKSVLLSTFFEGAIVKFDSDIEIKIPSLDQIRVGTMKNQYPTSTLASTVPIGVGNCMLNAAGAKFDAFVWLETVDGERILFAEQVKISEASASTKAVDIMQVNTEYDKVKSVVSAKFVFIMLCRRNGVIDQNLLPANSVIVCNSQLNAFYGDAYYQRLQE